MNGAACSGGAAGKTSRIAASSTAAAKTISCDKLSDILLAANSENELVVEKGCASTMPFSERLTFPQIWVESVCESSSDDEDDGITIDLDLGKRKHLSPNSSDDSSGCGLATSRLRRGQGQAKVIRSLLASCSTDVSFEAPSLPSSNSSFSNSNSRQNSFQLSSSSSRENSVDDFQFPGLQHLHQSQQNSQHLIRHGDKVEEFVSASSCPSPLEQVGPSAKHGEQGVQQERQKGRETETPASERPLEDSCCASGKKESRSGGARVGTAKEEEREEVEEAFCESGERSGELRSRLASSSAETEVASARDETEEEAKCGEKGERDARSEGQTSSLSQLRFEGHVQDAAEVTETDDEEDDFESFFPPDFVTPVSQQIEAWLNSISDHGFGVGLLQSFAKDEYGDDEEDEDVWFEAGLTRVFDPYYDLDPADIAEVEGKVSKATGQPVGLCTVKLTNGDDLFGTFRNGLRQGKGSIEGVNLLNHGLVNIRGFYKDSVLMGLGRAILAEGSMWELPHRINLEGVFNDGYLEGPVRGMDERGNLMFVGEYSKGLPTGYCWLAKEGQGWMAGCVDARGNFSGNGIAYLYPDKATCLLGLFRDGVMLRGVASRVVSAEPNHAHVLCLLFEESAMDGKSDFFTHAPSDNREIYCAWLLPDPYESLTVACRTSSVDGAGDGLFARRDVPAGAIVAYYNGLRVRPGDAYDAKEANYQIYVDWLDTDNSPYVDIPIAAIEFSAYRASLAHKANHSFVPNCKYVAMAHPRFGRIPCLKTLKPVARGQELFAHYKYDMALAPTWYQIAWENFQAASASNSSKEASEDEDEEDGEEEIRVQ